MLNPVIHVTLNWLGAFEGSAVFLLRFDTPLQLLEGKEQCHVVMVPTEGALPLGGNESRGGLLPVDFRV